MPDDDTIFDNLPPNPGGPQQQGAGGWAPAAWNRINALRKTEPRVAKTIAGLTPSSAPGYFFDSPVHNNMLSDVLNHHMMDQNMVERTTAPPQYTFGNAPQANTGYWRGQLDQLRNNASLAPPQGRPLPDEMASLQARAQPPPDPRASRIEPASQPWNTFGLKQPNMPPFPANDPRGPGPPGMTLNATPPLQFPARGGAGVFTGPPVMTRPSSGGLMSAEEMMQRIREGMINPQD